MFMKLFRHFELGAIKYGISANNATKTKHGCAYLHIDKIYTHYTPYRAHRMSNKDYIETLNEIVAACDAAQACKYKA